MNSSLANRRPRRRYPSHSHSACPDAHCTLCQSMERVSPTLQEFVAVRASRFNMNVGETVKPEAFQPGAVSTVSAGMIVLQKILDDGRRFVVDFVCPGETLCNGTIPSDLTAFAAIPSIVCVLDPELVSTMKRAYPQAAVHLYEMALTEREKSVNHMTMLARGSVEEKIAYFLNNLAVRTGRKISGGTEVDLPMTRGDIADYLGLNTETVSRQFSALKKSDAIKLPKPDRLIVPDVSVLQMMAEGAQGQVGAA